MATGYERPLYITLPFDHRGTFSEEHVWLIKDADQRADVAKIAAMKQVIYDGLQAALAGGVQKAKAGILVDEQFGTRISSATRRACGYVTACPAEKSGQGRSLTLSTATTSAHHIDTFHTRPSARSCSESTAPRASASMNRRPGGADQAAVGPPAR